MKTRGEKLCIALMVVIVSLMLAIAFGGCSIEKKCHRLEGRIVKNAKYCTLTLTDTLTVKDTVYIGTVRKDSTFVLDKSVDTFYINNERLHVQIVKEYDTLRVNARCDSIYVYKEIKVPYESVEVKEAAVMLRSFGRFCKRWFWVVIVAAVCFVLYKFKSKIPFLKFLGCLFLSFIFLSMVK